nr:putative late blight resistance protein homolog R1A-4 isoform X1 [Ipomoea batatas]
MFVPLKLLKVLAFDTSISLQRVPMQLGDLVFLRYLSITQWFQDLDDIVSNNPNLQTLVVSGNGAPTVHLPSSIWKPPHLRHLELGNSYLVDPPSADKKNLQTLCWVVRPLHCRKKVYSKFPNIKNLKILLKDDIEPNHIGGCCSNPIILDHFDYFKWLKNLSISVSFGCNVALPELARFPSGLKKLKLSGTNISEGDLNVIAKLPNLMVLKLENAFHGIVWEMPKDFIGYQLESIELEGCLSSLVASAKQLQQKRISMDFSSLNGNLEKLKLSGTNISEEDLNVIAKLPNLMVLKLENAFHGIVWEVAQNGFCELRFLLIEAKELKQWVVSSSFDFINLRHLALRSCNCLEEMPKDFIGYRLESIELEGGHSSLVAYAKQLQQKRISMGLFSLNEIVEIQDWRVGMGNYIFEVTKNAVDRQIVSHLQAIKDGFEPNFTLGLKRLKLTRTNISERDLTEIGKLCYLTVLKLENAFCGTVASHKDFPVLRHSVLRSCYCLEQIPKGLARIYTLKSIELEGCGSPLVASAKQFQWDTRNSFVEAKGPTLHLPSRIWEPPQTVYVSFKTEEVEVDGTNLYSCDLTVISMLAQLEVLIMGKYGK